MACGQARLMRFLSFVTEKKKKSFNQIVLNSKAHQPNRDPEQLQASDLQNPPSTTYLPSRSIAPLAQDDLRSLSHPLRQRHHPTSSSPNRQTYRKSNIHASKIFTSTKAPIPPTCKQSPLHNYSRRLVLFPRAG